MPVVYLTSLSVIQLISRWILGWLVDNELENIRKELVLDIFKALLAD
jgi:hypothetical protein